MQLAQEDKVGGGGTGNTFISRLNSREMRRQTASIHHPVTEYEMWVNATSYLTSWLSVPSRARLYPNPPPAERQAPAKTITTNAGKLLYAWVSEGGVTDEKKKLVVKLLRYREVEGKATKWEDREVMRVGERRESRAEAPDEWRSGSGDSPASRETLNLFICFSLCFFVSRALSLCGLILFRLPLPSPPLLHLGAFYFFPFCS